MANSERHVYSELMIRSRRGRSLLADRNQLSLKTLPQFGGVEDDVETIRERLEKAGFTVIAANRFGISLSGPEGLYKEYFKTGIAQRSLEIPVGKSAGFKAQAFLMEDAPRIPSELHSLTDSVYVPPIGTFYSGEGPMPTPGYYHLRPPGDIVAVTRADAAHARGYTGSGVRVAMVDSGFVEDHDYYNGRGYSITVMAAVGSTTADEVGHGTGIASNLLAIAPDCDFLFVKMFDGSNWASRAAFVLAVDNGARIITNSWGQPYDALLAADILDAISNGITVLFACGNGGPVGWPGCMEEVVSVGGAFPEEDGTWSASSYASSGVNALVPGRHCPDLSAIVGQAPSGIFIVMPTQAGAEFDDSFSGGSFPTGDETGSADGWLVASGTSSASPMVAGAAALMLEADTSLSPAQIQQALEDTCIDVLEGASASGEVAGIGPDSPTGTGMIDIGAAVDEVAPPQPCPVAPIVHCLRAPIQCLRAPQACIRAPLSCRTAPQHCVRAPLTCKTAPQQCVRAPLQCRTAPQQCARAPIQCRIGPQQCSRAPLQCRTAPLGCTRAPIIECRVAPTACGRAPIAGCAAGPYKDPGCAAGPVGRIPDLPDLPDLRGPGGLVPIVVWVDEGEAAALEAEQGAVRLDPSSLHGIAMDAAKRAYAQTLAQLGVEGELDDFPAVGNCRRGPFDPQASG